jgi:hypothetical protein
LFDLKRFRQRALRLKVHDLGNAFTRENVMASPDSLSELKPQQQISQVVETDVPIG